MEPKGRWFTTRKIINWLVYWQMGSCGRNCREKIQRVRVTNRSSGPTGRRGTVFWSFFFFSPFLHTNITQQAAGTGGYVQIPTRVDVMRCRDERRGGTVTPPAEVANGGSLLSASGRRSGWRGLHRHHLPAVLHTHLQACCKDMDLLKLVRTRRLCERALSYTHSLFMSKL